MIQGGMGRLCSEEKREELLGQHRRERDRRVADRIKAVLLYDEGVSPEEIAHVLFLSDEGVRKQIKDFETAQKLAPENGGSVPKLDGEQAQELVAHLEDHTYTDVMAIVAYVHKRFGIAYGRSGMTAWLHRNGFSFHKPASVPAKAEKAKQEAFIQKYQDLKRTLPENETILFVDGTHPTHQTRLAYGWIRKGHRKEIPMTSGQKRVNILGALDLETMKLVTKRYDTLNGAAVVDFFKLLEEQFPGRKLHVITDQGRYNTGPPVKEHLKTSAITHHLLPAYSPNLNAIERCWKLMHTYVTNNRYYATFNEFSEALDHFFMRTFPANARAWVDRLTDNFRPVQSPLLANS